jgi:hypothetical protein
MPSLLNTTVATNYGRMVSTENYTESAGVRTYTGPYTQFGTRQLKFLKVTAIHDSAAVNFSTSYTDKNSDFSLAVRAIQNYAEIYAVGTPDATGFIAVVAADTANGADSGNTQGTGYGLMEAAIKAAVEADTSATVVELTFDGVAIS